MSIVPADPLEPITPAMRARLKQIYPHAERLAVAMRLAGDLGTCAQLLRGEPVDPERLDKGELRRARERRLVRLDLREIDLLARQAA